MTTSEGPRAATEAPEPLEAERPSASAQEPKPRHCGVIQAFAALCVPYVERLMPDPYLFAVILTVIVAGLVAFLVHGATANGMLKAWYGGVWDGRISSPSPYRTCY